MGLFIGASVLTILEILDYIYEVRFITGVPPYCTRAHVRYIEAFFNHQKKMTVVLKDRKNIHWSTRSLRCCESC